MSLDPFFLSFSLSFLCLFGQPSWNSSLPTSHSLWHPLSHACAFTTPPKLLLSRHLLASWAAYNDNTSVFMLLWQLTECETIYHFEILSTYNCNWITIKIKKKKRNTFFIWLLENLFFWFFSLFTCCSFSASYLFLLFSLIFQCLSAQGLCLVIFFSIARSIAFNCTYMLMTPKCVYSPDPRSEF